MTTEKITSKQENRIGDLEREALRTLNLSKEDAQEIIESGDVLKKEVAAIYKKMVEANKKFGSPITEFELTVPADYNHSEQIDSFATKTKKLKTTYYYNDNLTDRNFAKATNKLEPGKTYKVKIIPILKQVTSDECLAVLKKHKAILVGGQGLTLAQELKAEEFPVGKWTVSFDEKDALWRDSDGYRRVPFVFRDSFGDWGFDLGSFENDWPGDDCLVCFCDLDA